MFSEMLQPPSEQASDTEVALRKTYHLYALGRVLEESAKPFLRKIFDGRTNEERTRDRINLINSSLSAGIDPNQTLEEAGLNKDGSRPFVPNTNFVTALLQKQNKKSGFELTKKSVGQISGNLGTLLKSESGHFLEPSSFLKFARKLKKL